MKPLEGVPGEAIRGRCSTLLATGALQEMGAAEATCAVRAGIKEHTALLR